MMQPQEEIVVSEPTKHVYHELENPEEGTTAKLPFYHELEGPTLPEVLCTCLQLCIHNFILEPQMAECVNVYFLQRMHVGNLGGEWRNTGTRASLPYS